MAVDKSWVRVRINPTEFHVLPGYDLHDHKVYDCSCNPKTEVEKEKGRIIDKVVVHKAWDNRPGPFEQT